MRQSKEAERFWSKVDKSGGADSCWPYRSRVGTADKYFTVRVGESYMDSHRAAYLYDPDAEIKKRREEMKNRWVLHSCDNKSCCNPAHLSLGDRQRNTNEAVARGLTCSGEKNIFSTFKGEKNVNAKLTEQRVEIIRRLAATHTFADLAETFDVTDVLIGKVVRREIWKHVP